MAYATGIWREGGGGMLAKFLWHGCAVADLIAQKRGIILTKYMDHANVPRCVRAHLLP
jgi:hypothetical protein